MRRREAIFLGDWLRAVHALGISDEGEQRVIAELLGLRPEITRTVVPERDLPTKENASTSGKTPVSVSREQGKTELREEVAAGAMTTLLPAQREEWKPPLWLSGVVPLPRPTSSEASYRPLLEPLLLPRWNRGILTGALATPSADGPIDVDRLVHDLAHALPIVSLPLLPWFTLHRGVQLLIDMGVGMLPFARDQSYLEKEICGVASEEKVEVLRFAGCPTRGAGRGGRRLWAAYRPPQPRTPILLLTDLGIARVSFSADHADVEEWLEFVRGVCDTNPLIALIPYAHTRWPQKLRPFMTMLPWDRATSTLTVRRQQKQEFQTQP